jgi:hypothetical protein
MALSLVSIINIHFIMHPIVIVSELYRKVEVPSYTIYILFTIKDISILSLYIYILFTIKDISIISLIANKIYIV